MKKLIGKAVGGILIAGLVAAAKEFYDNYQEEQEELERLRQYKIQVEAQYKPKAPCDCKGE